jgi:hypothetical protein
MGLARRYGNVEGPACHHRPSRNARDMPGDGRSTTSGHATARRFAAPHPYGPGARRQNPGTAASTRENNLPPQTAAPALPRKASQPTPSAARPPATCSTSFKQSRHAATAQVLTCPPAPAPASVRPANNPPLTGWPQQRAAAAPGQLRPRSARYGRTRPPQPASPRHRQPRRTASRGRDPARTIPIALDLFHDWSRPIGSRYQHGFSTGSGNDGKQPALSGQTGHETGPVNSRADRPGSRVHDRYNRRSD